MNQPQSQWIPLTLLAAIAAVAVAQDDEDSVVNEEISTGIAAPEPACFNVRDINGFDSLDDTFVYVTGRRDQHFLLTMDRSCFGLRNARGIAISNTINRVCSNSFGEITYRDFNTVVNCRIREVEAVADKETATAIAERRKNQE